MPDFLSLDASSTDGRGFFSLVRFFLSFFAYTSTRIIDSLFIILLIAVPCPLFFRSFMLSIHVIISNVTRHCARFFIAQTRTCERL